ncbi:hypothetical protein [Tissierella carlieri]|uniref:hypothetical protein n=1 Tax=Tissierella carlieri TaxID=689904 RepID=UPI0038682497
MEINEAKRAYDSIADNLNAILNKYKDYNLNIYFLDNKIYYIVETWLPDIGKNDYQLDLYTYKLEEHSFQISPVSTLNATIKLSHDYRIKTAYIDALDTVKELRKGHGTQLLKRFITIAKNSDINFIRGKLYRNTPIGIEDLKTFYSKNGFEVSEDRIYMLIKNVEEKIEY